MKYLKAATVFIWDIWKKNFAVKIFSKVKLICSYKKSFLLGHFCVTHSQTDSQTHRETDGKVGLQSCMSQLKMLFLGHFCVTQKQTHTLTNSQTRGRKGRLTELHVAAKKGFLGHFCKHTNSDSQTHRHNAGHIRAARFAAKNSSYKKAFLGHFA